MEELCENFRLIAYWVVTLQWVKFRKLDVCGSIVLSNSVTYEENKMKFEGTYLSDGWADSPHIWKGRCPTPREFPQPN